MDGIFRAMLVLQIVLLESILLGQAKRNMLPSSGVMRLLKIGAFTCMLLCLFIQENMLPVALGMAITILHLILIRVQDTSLATLSENRSVYVFCHWVSIVSLIFFVVLMFCGVLLEFPLCRAQNSIKANITSSSQFHERQDGSISSLQRDVNRVIQLVEDAVNLTCGTGGCIVGIERNVTNRIFKVRFRLQNSDILPAEADLEVDLTKEPHCVSCNLPFMVPIQSNR